MSQIGHSFALSFQEGGIPFCIYKQKRSWHRTTTRGVTMPIHAIAILPGGEVEELHCGSTFTFDRGGWFTAGLYQFVDRNTGQLIDADPPAPPPPHGVAPTLAHQDAMDPPPQPLQRDGHAAAVTIPTQQAKELAKTFYGLRVPSIEHECWLRAGGAQGALGDPTDPLNHPTAISEAINHHDRSLSETTINGENVEAST
jgi:hypothetical protein